MSTTQAAGKARLWAPRAAHSQTRCVCNGAERDGPGNAGGVLAKGFERGHLVKLLESTLAQVTLCVTVCVCRGGGEECALGKHPCPGHPVCDRVRV